MNLSSSLLFTLVYADIFQYPYTFDELVTWTPHNSWNKSAIRKQVTQLVKKKIISEKFSFITLYGHTNNIQVRLKREKHASAKWEKAKRAGNILRWVPSVVFVGVTGGLAIHNADKEDDIDLYVCTKKGTLWITRFFSIMLLEAFGIRRRPETREVKDAICLNMFVSEDALAVTPGDRDVYTAHEVLQVRPVWERENTYVHFLKKNIWVARIFPVKWKDVISRLKNKKEHVGKQRQGQILVRFMRLLEKPAKYLQLWYMHKRRTSEVVSDTILRFHPHDARIWIVSSLQKKLLRYHLPLDKNFFHS